jgi:hypothetical protein
MKRHVQRICDRYITCRHTKSRVNLMGYIHLYMFRRKFEMIFLWILFLIYLGLGKEETLYLLLWIDFIASHKTNDVIRDSTCCS